MVAGLGSTAWDVTAAGDRPLNFPLWGAMGGAAMLGLGLALAQPARRVLVMTGDGELLMGLGSLATIAVQRPPNLAIVVFDNERYGETGMQADPHRAWRRPRHRRRRLRLSAHRHAPRGARGRGRAAAIRTAPGPAIHIRSATPSG